MAESDLGAAPPDDPTPEDRAAIVVRVLEQTIREGRNDPAVRSRAGRPGISFRDWQDVARIEIAAAIREAEAVIRSRRAFGTRIAMTVAACLVTVGFFGAAVSWGRVDRTLAAMASLAAGAGLFLAVMEIPLRRSARRGRARRRARKFENLRNLDRQVAVLERLLEDRRKALEDRLEGRDRLKL